MQRYFAIFYFLIFSFGLSGQTGSFIDSFRVWDDVKVTIDRQQNIYIGKETIITFFALPNGNTTAQTMGKKMQPGDDWHFDIQHIRAQTEFIRQQLKRENLLSTWRMITKVGHPGNKSILISENLFRIWWIHWRG